MSGSESGGQHVEAGCQLSNTRRAPGAEREGAAVRIAVMLAVTIAPYVDCKHGYLVSRNSRRKHAGNVWQIYNTFGIFSP